jgi:hypothetical protein
MIIKVKKILNKTEFASESFSDQDYSRFCALLNHKKRRNGVQFMMKMLKLRFTKYWKIYCFVSKKKRRYSVMISFLLQNEYSKKIGG